MGAYLVMIDALPGFFPSGTAGSVMIGDFTRGAFALLKTSLWVLMVDIALELL
jgi:hypothetical protein